MVFVIHWHESAMCLHVLNVLFNTLKNHIGSSNPPACCDCVLIFDSSCAVLRFPQSLRCVWLFVSSWTVISQAPLSMGFPRQEYWSGLPFPPPGDLPDLRIKPASPALAGGFLTKVDSSPPNHLGSPDSSWCP